MPTNEKSEMKHLSLFSGIGGFDLAAEWMGWENVAQVEIDKFCLKILEKNFPKTKRYEDIKSFPASDYIGRIDIVTGGFPCQPFSQAGARRGTEDDRHLWPEMLRVISIVKPTWIVAENVRGLLTINDGVVFEQVCTDLEKEGYEVQPIIIPACAVNAPHRRDRVWFIAYNANTRTESVCEWENSVLKTTTNLSGERLQRCLQRHEEIKSDARQEAKPWSSSCDWSKNWPQVATELCSVDDGIPKRMDRLKALGNAIVPQVAYQIFKSLILSHERRN